MEKLEYSFKQLIDAQNKYKYLCIYGAGDRAKSIWYPFFKDFYINIDFFCDSDLNKWHKEIIDNKICISPQELIKYKGNVLCIICTSFEKQQEIESYLSENKLDTIRANQGWFSIKSVVEKYLGIQVSNEEFSHCCLGEYDREIDPNEKIAVYTSIIGDYDELKQPEIIEERCDYYYLGIEKPKQLGVYKWIDIAGISEINMLDKGRINRFCKLHPHLFFAKYKYSIYIDGSFKIKKNISHIVSKISDIGIAVYGGEIKDTYGQAAIGCIKRKEEEKIVIGQMKRYLDEGFPRNYGFSENGIIVREHNNEECIKIMNTWWNEILKGSGRDQLSFFYSVWKNGYQPKDIGEIGKTHRSASEVSLYRHKDKEELCI